MGRRYRKKVLTGEVARKVRHLIGQMATEREITILSGNDHIHPLGACRPHVDVSGILH